MGNQTDLESRITCLNIVPFLIVPYKSRKGMVSFFTKVDIEAGKTAKSITSYTLSIS